MSLTSNDFIQHTFFKYWAVRNASINDNNIVFQHGADIKVFDIENDQVSDISISLQSDFAGLLTHYIDSPVTYYEGASPTNDGNSAVIVARGKMAIAHKSSKRLISLAADPTARHRHAITSEDGDIKHDPNEPKAPTLGASFSDNKQGAQIDAIYL